ncbi:MAG: T9SS type A sorting domain-containing protein [Bacteroidetes bacterium]|nr:T9SS type A sorting domain-containing protein [Bacteroidota bacterium]
MKRFLKIFTLFVFVSLSLNGWGQTQLVLDDFGTVAQNPISRTGWTANAASGTAWELRITSPSSTYSWASPVVSASGGANVFTNLGTNSNTKQLTYSNSISTVGYSSIKVRFGGVKTGTVPNLNVLYSTDGITYVSAGAVTLTTTWAAYVVNLPVAAEGVANLRIRFEIVANSATANFFRIDDFHIIGTSVSPTLTVAPTTLTGFTYAFGSGPSTSQSYNLSGTFLTGFPSNILVTAPADYEVSLDNITFTATVNVAYASATLAATPIYVRLKAGLAVGTYNGEIVSNAGGGATTKNVTIDGNVTAAIKPEPAAFPTLFTCGVTTTSTIPLTWTDASAATAPDGYLIKWSSVSYAAIVDPIDGTAEANGATTQNILQGVQTYTASGLTSSTTYFFKIWSYTNAGASINYKLTGEPQTSCATTAPVTSACGTEGFAGGTAAPAGWVFNSIGGTYTTATNYGAASPSLQMNATGDAVTTATVTSPGLLSFWIKGQGTDATSALLVEGWDGSAWVTIDNIVPIPTTGTTKTYNSGLSFYTMFRFTYNRTAGNLSFDDVNVVCNTATITTGAVAVSPFIISCNVTAAGTVAFTSTGTYTGNTYTAQLSDPTGSFTVPTNIGTLVSDANTGTINITIPANAATSPLYQIRVISNSPMAIGTASAAFTITNSAPCTITPGAITGAPFSVTCGSSAAGTIAFTSTATYAGNTYTVLLSNASGSFATPYTIGTLVSNANSGVIPITIPAGIPAGAGYLIRIISNSPAVVGASTAAITINNATPCIITPNVLSSAPFAVTCPAGIAGTLTFTSNATYSGNTYTAQLSDASGSFASPVNIGTLVSDANSGTINLIIPAGTPTGVAYQIRIISSSPHVIGSSTAAFTINLTGGPCPTTFQIESILVDACDGGTGLEGVNEMVRFQIGTTAQNTSNLTVNWPSNPWKGICQNATTASVVAAINTTITGGGMLVEPVGGVLPAGAQVMLFTNTGFNYPLFDFSALNYTIYAIFQCPNNTAGHFVNHSSTNPTNRTLTMNFAGAPGESDAVTYNAYFVYAGDGGAVEYDAPGNPTYGSAGAGCQAPLFPLPVELIQFTAKYNSDKVDLVWQTASEKNNDYFTIEKSRDAEVFHELTTVNGAGNSNVILHYAATDRNPYKGISYYRLKQTDFDGMFTYSNIVSVVSAGENNLSFAEFIASQESISATINCSGNEKLNVIITDVAGRMIYSSVIQAESEAVKININSQNLAKGIYLMKIEGNNGGIFKKFGIL